ncbi:MAG: indolepyruvate ferredoxin oxidoreductase subunit alpha [Candidatus Nealsonbacteria bacterium CG23_combo_of_CG06-09_8_20_14_all_39_25]|uniref:Indolepyruvate oxidoreductase subunit IorA n=3 Tax=Candidatus Nealsoniibacteriota TaxID=1817911 RepID=A0A2G9YS22_9BACT|nr:MAG: indolepyruvate ferredoxin oxidoreductase subunit alpha [Candidatus Nealsonbacteria bacterium CG23_combo_of_CG06-09_8_20_14_all_39_25]PIZ88347.1 MAG: indolepyruvate ferredoxin oxidoreductase subunit alpha [Candidatus Nealsonbacteria bacterium CG_4_10_14_0_2_um_filter_39_15]
MEELLLNKPGKKIILLGNEAIVRGALEAGVQFVSTYPGTPASDIGDTFFRIAKKAGVYFEYSTNEKVAMEAGIGASFSGLKTLVAMKDFGLNVCLDALGPFVYTGVKGPTVIVVADDPSCYSSAQWEENTRGLALALNMPTLEPADPQECIEFTKLAFQISEKFKIPVMIRTTTRVAHQRAPVRMSNMEYKISNKGKFIKNPKQFVTLPPRVLEMKKELLEKIEKVKEFSEKSPTNYELKRITNKLGIITSGISYLYVREALNELKLGLPILKLGFFYPLPEEKIKNFIKNFKKVLIVEELEPFLEKEVERLAKEANCKLKVIGKELIPEVGEIKPEIVTLAIAKFANCKLKIENSLKIRNWKLKIPKRFPQLCPGCPYWFVFGAIKRAVDPKKVIFGGDIGCYMLAGFPPHLIQDYLFCMGSSIGIAHGIKKATDQKLITFIGDSTFFHAGIPALINTVFNNSNPLIIILDNRTTAMTGHQPHPGAPATQNGLKIENVVKGLGIKNLKVIDPINQEEFIAAIKEFLNKKEVSVIVARRPCVQIKK